MSSITITFSPACSRLTSSLDRKIEIRIDNVSIDCNSQRSCCYCFASESVFMDPELKSKQNLHSHVFVSGKPLAKSCCVYWSSSMRVHLLYTLKLSKLVLLVSVGVCAEQCSDCLPCFLYRIEPLQCAWIRNSLDPRRSLASSTRGVTGFAEFDTAGR